MNILVVDDEPNVRRSLSIFLRRRGFHVDEADSGESALGKIAAKVYDLMITDLRMSPMDGLELLRRAKRVAPPMEVIVITAYGSVESGVRAMKEGAFDYVTKPFDNEELVMLVERALDMRRLEEEVNELRARLREKYGAEAILGRSRKMMDVMRMVTRVAKTDSTILITGESGTGKELVARAIHANSNRAQGPWVAVNCGAIPENLQESEFFGYVRGAFTGAIRDKIGLVQEADGGTLFLDEIGETSPALQVKLLRFLQDGEVRRVGDTRSRRVDVRLIAATNQDLEKLVREGRFREDLFYRLSVIPIRLPALRERREDIPVLAAHFTRRFSEELGRAPVGISSQALALLMEYDWPGNVRELENVMERAVVLCQGDRIMPEDLPPHFWGEDESLIQVTRRKDMTLEELERFYILHVLHKYGGNRKKAADVLGLSRATLWRKLRQYGVDGAFSAEVNNVAE